MEQLLEGRLRLRRQTKFFGDAPRPPCNRRPKGR